jgi:hypothetical protein
MTEPTDPDKSKPFTARGAGSTLGRLLRRRVEELEPRATGNKLGRLVRRRVQEAEVGRRLKPIGKRIDRFVTLLVVALLLTYGAKFLWYVLTQK